MPKIINKLIGKGKQRENSATLPLPDISSSQGALAALQLGDTIPTLPIPISTKNKPNIGLFELSTNETEKTIDVVAVHGLQSDAYKTWEHDNGFLWLRDFLPVDIPDARIMTFGYDSTVAFSKSVIGTSTDIALLSDLEKGSTTLANISQQFVDRTQDMIIYTFYETERLRGIMVCVG